MNIENEIEKTMAALDDVEHAKASPYFFSRLQRRLSTDDRPSLLTSLWTEPRYLLAVAAIILILSVNIFSVFEYQKMENIHTTVSSDDQQIEILAQEYELNMPALYDEINTTNGSTE